MVAADHVEHVGLTAQEHPVVARPADDVVDLDELPALFSTVPGTERWPIKADSARPETISYMCKKGYAVTEKRREDGTVILNAVK